jgi:hypothetical protein
VGFSPFDITELDADRVRWMELTIAGKWVRRLSMISRQPLFSSVFVDCGLTAKACLAVRFYSGRATNASIRYGLNASHNWITNRNYFWWHRILIII